MTDENKPLQAPPRDDLESAHTIAPPEIEPPPSNTTSPLSKCRRLPTQILARMLTLAARGLGYRTIAKALSIPAPTVQARLRQFKPMLAQLRNVEYFQHARERVISAAEFQALKSMMQPDKHAAAPLRDVAYAFKALHGAGRLERNLTTSNTATVNLKPLDLSHLSKSK